MPLNINQTSSAVQSRIVDQLNAQSPDALKTSSKFGARLANLFTSKAGIEKKNSQLAAKLLSTLTSQVGQTIANRSVDKLLSQRDVKILSAVEVNAVIKEAAEDYAKALAAFSESPLTKELLPNGKNAPLNLSESGKEAYTTSLISHCLAKSFDIGITPKEMIALLSKGPSAGHSEHYQALEQLSTKSFPAIAQHAAALKDVQFRLTPTTITYKKFGEDCLKGTEWYGKPPEEAEAIYSKTFKQSGGKIEGKGPADKFYFGDTRAIRHTDPAFINLRDESFDKKMAAKGFDVSTNDTKEGPSNNKIHLNVNAEDMDKAFQVLFPLLTSPDTPFNEMKFTNFECHKPGKQEHMAKYSRLMTEGETPEIRAEAADKIRMGNRVHVGNQFTLYCPTYTNPETRKFNIQQQKEFIKIVEGELKKAGIRPGDKSEGHELPNLDFTTFRWEANSRIPSAKLPEDQLAKVRSSDVYQAFNA